MKIKHLKVIYLLSVFVFFAFVLCGCEAKDSGLYQISDNAQPLEIETDTNDTKPSENTEEPESVDSEEGIQEIQLQKVYVHICGAVNNPGVYELAIGDRIFNVVELAGGFREDADEGYVNLAEPIADGMKIVIPTVDEAMGEEIGIVYSGTNQVLDISLNNGELVNINTADIATLCTITGIGETKAKAIIEYRETVGLFTSAEDIMNVKGIGEGTYSKIKDEITIR